MKKVDLKKSWNRIAKSYQTEFFGTYGASKITTKPMDFVGNVKGKKIIEVGSGAGQNSIIFAQRGAVATAIDFSEKQINYGRLLAKKHKVDVNFIVGDLNNLEKYFEKNKFDIAFSTYTFQYIENLDKLLHAVNRILKKNGLFVFSLDHPMFTSGSWLKVKNKEHFFVNDYFKRRKIFSVWRFKGGVQAKFYLHHRPLQDFFDALVKNNFTVEKIVEPEPLELYKNPPKGYGSWKVKKGIPYMIIFKARKISNI